LRLLLRWLLIEWMTTVIHHLETKRRALGRKRRSSDPFRREACKGALVDIASPTSVGKRMWNHEGLLFQTGSSRRQRRQFYTKRWPESRRGGVFVVPILPEAGRQQGSEATKKPTESGLAATETEYDRSAQFESESTVAHSQSLQGEEAAEQKHRASESEPNPFTATLFR
jgi:hypothetical protein